MEKEKQSSKWKKGDGKVAGILYSCLHLVGSSLKMKEENLGQVQEFPLRLTLILLMKA